MILLIDKLVEVIRYRNIKIAVAESCTGGLLAAALTSIPGSSDFFQVGLVTYSNQSKINILGVNSNTIAKHGAVSEQTAKEMALNIKKMAGTDIGVSITGIAGPGGGSIDKPVGLVYIGVTFDNDVYVYKNFYCGDRESVRNQATLSTIEYIYLILKNTK